MEKNPEEFSKKELMMMVFGKDGAVPGLHKKMNELCRTMDGFSTDIKHIRNDLKEYNGLKSDLILTAKELSEHRKFCHDRQTAIRVEEETKKTIAERIAEERAEARKDERESQDLRYDKQLRLLKFIAVMISAIALFITIGGLFIW